MLNVRAVLNKCTFLLNNFKHFHIESNQVLRGFCQHVISKQLPLFAWLTLFSGINSTYSDTKILPTLFKYLTIDITLKAITSLASKNLSLVAFQVSLFHSHWSQPHSSRIVIPFRTHFRIRYVLDPKHHSAFEYAHRVSILSLSLLQKYS